MKQWISTPLLIEQLKRFWAIPALTTLGFLFFILIPLYTADPHTWSNPEMRMALLLTGNNYLVSFLSVVMPLAAAVALFPYHFNGVANIAFNSFPVRRRQLFCTNVLAGILMFLVPLLLLTLAALIPVQVTQTMPAIHSTHHTPYWFTDYIWRSRLYPGDTLNTFPVVMGFFGRTLLTFGVYYALGIATVSITGNRIATVFIAAAFSFLPIISPIIAIMASQMYVFGINVWSIYEPANTVMNYVHPVMIGSLIQNPSVLALTARDAASPQYLSWPLYLSYALIMIGLLALGAFCCLRRKSERAGETVAFAPLKNVLIFALSLAGMIYIGLFLAYAIGSIWAYYVGFVVGFVITFFIAQMIANKTFHVFKKVKKLPVFALVAVGLYLIFLFVTRVGMLGYITHTPDFNEVRGVFVGHMWPVPRNPYSEEGRDYVLVTDPGIIARTIDVHEQIIAERRLRGYGRQQHFITGWRRHGSQFPITYILNNGKMITRLYTLPHDFIVDSGIEALLREEAVILSVRPELLNSAALEQINVLMPSGHHSRMLLSDFPRYEQVSRGVTTIEITQRGQIQSLAEAIRHDFVASTRADRDMHHTQHTTSQAALEGWEPMVEISIQVRTPNGPRWYGYGLRISDRTVAWLEQEGLWPPNEEE